uniref:Uncharacterized protein n=1 Tax=Salix viminalis TaxID=40686 RepID=A0A6N2MTW6_SALVM
MSAIKSYRPLVGCPFTSFRSTKSPSPMFPMQNLEENRLILKYMECKESHLMFWLLTMEKKKMRIHQKLLKWIFHQLILLVVWCRTIGCWISSTTSWCNAANV